MPPSMKSGNLCCGPALFSSAAFILSIYANSRCNLMSVSSEAEGVDGPFPLPPTSFGLYCFEAQNGVWYDTRDIDFDSKFQAARALGTTTSALGCCVWLFYCFAGCCRFSPKYFKIAGFFCFCCTTFQGLVFLVKKSEVCASGCSLDTGGKCAISAIVLWFLSSLMSCAAGKEPEETAEKVEEQDAEKGED